MPSGDAREAHIELACDPTSASAARRFTRGLAPPGTAATVELLVSELVTNAVVHARSDVVLNVTASSDGIRVEVRDASASPPVPKAPTTLDQRGDVIEVGDHGRGLQLVSALATQWGTQRQGTGKSVWFEVTADRRATQFGGAATGAPATAG